MNIFYIDEDPVTAARWLVDKHIRKMGLESTQMLSGAYGLAGAIHPPPRRLNGEPYRGGYRHHPSTVWAGETIDQWDWLARHAEAIFDEYAYRFGRRHGSADALSYMLGHRPVWLPPGWRDPPQCMPDDYKAATARDAYRAFYRDGKARLHHWTGREPPPWLDAA